MAGRSGLVSLTVAGMLWGTGGLLGSLLHRVTGLSPVSVATYRLAVGGLLLVAVLTLMRRPWPRTRAAWRRIGAVAVLAAIFQASYFGAVAAASVSLPTLITIGASPVLISLLEHLTGRRRLDQRRVMTIGLALAGLALLIGMPSADIRPTALLAGAALSLVAAAGFATMTVIGATPVPELDEMTTTGYGFALGALFLTPLAALSGITFTPDAESIPLILTLGLLPTAIAYSLYFRSLRDVGPGTAAMLALLEPLTGTALAVWLLGDRLGLTGVIGAGLLSIAMILAALHTPRVQAVPVS
ncbi:DMT family transporter [Nocardia sp. NPDC052566]|uniref:DMT family transporter n=1 Tax=Nocardia sp. NPDC052566 TaxID=3364330 RepID=UPI0037C6F22B